MHSVVTPGLPSPWGLCGHHPQEQPGLLCLCPRVGAPTVMESLAWRNAQQCSRAGPGAFREETCQPAKPGLPTAQPRMEHGVRTRGGGRRAGAGLQVAPSRFVQSGRRGQHLSMRRFKQGTFLTCPLGGQWKCVDSLPRHAERSACGFWGVHRSPHPHLFPTLPGHGLKLPRNVQVLCDVPTEAGQWPR